MLDQLDRVLRVIGEGLPGLPTVCAVLLATRAVANQFSHFFDAVQAGRIQVPFLHPEITSAIRRTMAALVWLLGLGIAYP